MADNKNISQKAAVVIMKREISSYFSSPIAYIVTGLFLVFSGFMFFSTFFLANRAELRNFFGLLPITLSFFVPALTMRLFSEEKRSGSIETLMTLPVTSFDVVMGKFLASFITGASMLVPTLFYVVTCAIFGRPDFGPILCGYLGALFLIAAFSAIGIFASSVTKNQIISFFIACAISIALSLMDSFFPFIPAVAVKILAFFSARSHFDSVARGIIDSRDIVYFVSVTAVFFVLTIPQAAKGKR